jgi:hypothetical protein
MFDRRKDSLPRGGPAASSQCLWTKQAYGRNRSPAGGRLPSHPAHQVYGARAAETSCARCFDCFASAQSCGSSRTKSAANIGRTGRPCDCSRHRGRDSRARRRAISRRGFLTDGLGTRRGAREGCKQAAGHQGNIERFAFYS